ncbi:MAG TPA: zinc ribbon domain-containing protein [Holophagaceae bacterium]|nr:zinc ribbon domain-containing protein [Holophagaceae bacterium]
MPLYEYRCQSCGAGEEVIESFSAPAEHACPACGVPDGMRRQLSRSGFVLAGGGWYASGYGEGKSTGAPEASKPEAAPASPAPSAGCGGGCSCH